MNKLAAVIDHHSNSKSSLTFLVADVGATKTDLAICHFREGTYTIEKQERFVSSRFNNFSELLLQFHFHPKEISALSIAFAGPIIDGVGKATNLDWIIDEKKLSQELDDLPVYLLNDLEAHAYGLERIDKNELIQLHSGKSNRPGNAAIIAPGTGLGEAGLFWDGKKHQPFATEGGHTDFAPRTELEDLLLQSLRSRFGHVSWERVLSGPGLWNIYEFLRKGQQAAYPDCFYNIQQTKDKAILVSTGARMEDPICLEAMELFYKFLAVESANLAVKLNATGGIFIAGGMVPNTIELLNKEAFNQHFLSMGRLEPLLREIPIFVICNKYTALIGALFYAVETRAKRRQV